MLQQLLNPSESSLLPFCQQKQLMEFDLGWKPLAWCDGFMMISYHVNYGFHTSCAQQVGGCGDGWGNLLRFAWSLRAANDYLSKRLRAEASAGCPCLLIFFLIQVTTLEIIANVYNITGIHVPISQPENHTWCKSFSILSKPGTAYKRSTLACNWRKTNRFVNWLSRV